MLSHDTPSPFKIYLPLFLILSWFIYLSTLSPTVFYRDTPEFVNTAFALGISHPAGFPIYNLMAKTVTFFPMGSVPFKINLFSSLMACLALLILYAASLSFLRVLAGKESSESFLWPALLPVGMFAFSVPFWSNTMLAEVYTLHTFFTVSIVLALLKWKEQEDIRYLYAAALIYGLSAGNHGTVAFYLPAIMILFFFWCRQNPWRHLSLCSAFFLLGFSVYAYLPIRSLTEPTFDWGNPETLKGFLFQITDRKDAHSHFGVLSPVAGASAVAETGASMMSGITRWFSKSGHVIQVFIGDVAHSLSWVSVAGFLMGAVVCFRKSLPLFLFFSVIVATNTAFFVSWRGEAFLPSYVVVTLLTALALYQILYTAWWQRRTQEASRSRRTTGIWNTSGTVGMVVFLALGLSVPWAIWKNYSRVDHSWNHLSESMTRRVYLTLPDRAVFISGMSWFFYNYNQDVRRLRDDVTALTVWDLISPHRTGLLTPRRYPNLFLPDSAKYDLKTLEGISDYSQELVQRNAVAAPVVLEANETLFEQTKFTEHWQPYRNVLLQYNPPALMMQQPRSTHLRSWREFKNILETELARPGSGRDVDWINIPMSWINSLRNYFHATGEYELEREVLEMQRSFLGYRGREWGLNYLDNLVLTGRLGKAQLWMDQFQQEFPGTFEAHLGQGLLRTAQGRLQEGLAFFQQAVALHPQSFRAHLERAGTLRQLQKEPEARSAMMMARDRIDNVRQLMAYRKALHPIS
ncbi:MAG: DUF2723 domain-containing protein [Nitrospinae bacterium]|nr:DUF2723 domain-containing protein [Nitrospinota bacterium]